MVHPLLDPDARLQDTFTPDDRAALTCIAARVRLLEERDAEGARRLIEPLSVRAAAERSSPTALAEVELWLAWTCLFSDSIAKSREALSRMNVAAQRLRPDAHPDVWLWLQVGRARALHGLGHEHAAVEVATTARSLIRMLGDATAERWLPALPEDEHHPRSLHPVSLSPSMASVIRDVQVAEHCGIPVLISGEAGVGKRHLARAIHATRGGAEVRVFRCHGESDEMIERELIGLIVEDADSMLVFPEFHRLPFALQTTLATWLDQRATTGSGPVFTSTYSLDQLFDQGRVAPELLPWCGQWTVNVPPLRARMQDVPLLVHTLLARLRPKDIPPVAITDDAMKALASYSWPGNLRQLSNELERALALVRAEPAPVVDLHRLSQEIVAASGSRNGSAPEAAANLDQILADKERAVIESVLARNGGQVSASADLLGLTRQGLYKKMKRLRVDPIRYQSEANGSAVSDALDSEGRP